MFPSNKVETQLHDICIVLAGFFVGNMTNQINQKNNSTLDTIVEQWVKLVMAQIEDKKQKTNLSRDKKEEEDEQ